MIDENLNDCSDILIYKLKNENYQLRKVNMWVIITALIVTCLLIYISVTLKHQDILIESLNTQLEQEEQMLSLEYSIGYWFINQPEQINDSILYLFLKNNNAWYPEILLKQAKLESGNYTSDVFNNTNNLYGMKKVGKRQTTQLKSTYNGYGCYTNWCESVLDRMLWDIFMFGNNKPTKEEYLSAMNIYAEDMNYESKII
jgi:hypothetical protein